MLRTVLSTAFLAAMAAAVLTLSGCIKEWGSISHAQVEVSFRYHGNGSEDIFADRVDSVLMYIYELPSCSLADTIRLHKSDLQKQQGAMLQLEPGDYRIICWGNAGDSSHVALGAGGEGRIMPRALHEGRHPTGIEELYYGCTELQVPLTLQAVHEEMVYSASYTAMQVELLGFADIGNLSLEPADGEQQADVGGKRCNVRLTHAGHSAYIGFDNLPGSDELTDYEPLMVPHPTEEDSYLLSYMVPRMDNTTGATLSITRTDTGELLYISPLSELMDVLGIVLNGSNEQTVRISLRASVSPTDVVVNVIGWDHETVYPGLE